MKIFGNCEFCGIDLQTLNPMANIVPHRNGSCREMFKPAQPSASEGERVCDICKQDISGHEFDGHCSVVCHKPSCIEQFAHPEGERVEQNAIVKLREALGNLMRIYQLPDNEWNQPLPGQFFRDAQNVYEETARLVPTKGGADHE